MSRIAENSEIIPATDMAVSIVDPTWATAPTDKRGKGRSPVTENEPEIPSAMTSQSFRCRQSTCAQEALADRKGGLPYTQ